MAASSSAACNLKTASRLRRNLDLSMTSSTLALFNAAFTNAVAP